MVSLLTQVTVVPGTTEISLGMKVLWSMLTVAAGPAPALFASSAKQGADAKVFLIADEGYNPYQTVAITRRALWNEHPDRVRAFALQQGQAAGYNAGELLASPRTLGTRDLMHFLFGMKPGDEPRKPDVR